MASTAYTNPKIYEAAELLKRRFKTLDDKTDVLRALELQSLYDELRQLSYEERPAFGQELNRLKAELRQLVAAAKQAGEALPPIDLTAPFDLNVPPGRRPRPLPVADGAVHPLMAELQRVLDIFYRMGFAAVEPREVDDDFHMFGSLNFPEGHPARDDYDTFMLEQTGKDGKHLIAPAHTSSMQHRVLLEYKEELEKKGKPIAVVIPGRVFRNEDLDARHEHTFYQLEGVYVGEDVTVGHLLATLKTFLQAYYEQHLEIRTQPFYFPFTEPSFEFSLSCPFCKKKGCQVCSRSGWIELLGCGLIHPNVLHMAGIDPKKYRGFTWGGGIDRLVMMKYGIEDVRHFHAGRLDFLRQFGLEAAR